MERLGKAGDGFEYVLSVPRRDALVDHQAMQVFRAGLVVADAAFGPDRGGEQVGAQRDLALQQHVEAAPRERAAQIGVDPPATRLVEYDEFDPLEVADQLRFELADDPGDAALRQRALQAPHQRHDVGHIAERRQAQDANRRGMRGLARHDRLIDFEP